MKVIRISNTLHEYLKNEAKREGRTLQWLVEERLANPQVPTLNVSADNPVVSDDWETVRTPKDVLNEIRELEKSTAEQLEFNQDPESRKALEKDLQVDTTNLWEEYHSIKEGER